MWYDDLYNKSIKAIKDYDRPISKKEYWSIAKEKELLSIESLKFITKLSFVELVKKIRKNK